MLLNYNGALRPVLKILTDYPRNDLAHDEVHQALVVACVRQKLDCVNIDVGAIPGLDTVAAGFKTAQLALNSPFGFGHVFHTNCAPRTNMVSIRSQGEKVVLGMTRTGVALLLVNSGYTLALFHELAERGEMAFFQTSVPDAGSQFRSRDFFPDALAELAAHLVKQFAALGEKKIQDCLAKGDYSTIVKGLPWLEAPMDVHALPHMPPGIVMYIDNFGNVKLNFCHRELLKHYKPGDIMAVRLGDTVRDTVMGEQGFSAGEGMMALTSGSSGWTVCGEKMFFTEMMLRGAPVSSHFGNFHTGDRVLMLRESDLRRTFDALRQATHAQAEHLRLHNISEAKVIAMLARVGLIKNGYDTSELQKSLEKGDLLSRLEE